MFKNKKCVNTAWVKLEIEFHLNVQKVSNNVASSFASAPIWLSKDADFHNNVLLRLNFIIPTLFARLHNMKEKVVAIQRIEWGSSLVKILEIFCVHARARLTWQESFNNFLFALEGVQCGEASAQFGINQSRDYRRRFTFKATRASIKGGLFLQLCMSFLLR